MFHPMLFPWTDYGLRALETQISSAQWMAQTWQQWLNTAAQGAAPTQDQAPITTATPARRGKPKRSLRPVASRGK